MEENAMRFPKGVGDPLLRPFEPAHHQPGNAVDPTTDEVEPVNHRGNATTLESLYVEHRRRLTHLAAAITLDRGLAEEVVQDVFVGLQQRMEHVHNPAGYLQQSVVQRSISVLRRRRVAARHPMPVAQVSVSPDIDETWGAVTGLPARERAAVVLRYWLDMSESDIAAALGWPNGTVKSTLHRALKRLEKGLQP
jgi:RNA polymerase sigma factor (sigma-70 family)